MGETGKFGLEVTTGEVIEDESKKSRSNRLVSFDFGFIAGEDIADVFVEFGFEVGDKNKKSNPSIAVELDVEEVLEGTVPNGLAFEGGKVPNGSLPKEVLPNELFGLPNEKSPNSE